MEVTSVVKQAVVLILFCSTNGYGQMPLQFQSNSAQGSSRSQSQPSAVVGVPQGSFVLQNLSPSAYADNSLYRDVSLPAFSSSQAFSTGLNNAQSSKPSLLTSSMAAIKNTGYFLLATLDLTDADRHDRLRAAAGNVNDVLDTLAQLLSKLRNYKVQVFRTLLNLPVIGFFLQMFQKVAYAINYIPIKILRALKKLFRSTFKTNQPKYDPYLMAGLPAAAYAYA